MEHFLNFTLIDQPARFHVCLPWSHLHSVDFYEIEKHLKEVVPTDIFEKSRKLKLSEHQPETGSVDFHCWLRQQSKRS